MPRNRPKENTSENARPGAISKSLSYVLRHAAEREGLKIDAQGYLIVSDVVCMHTQLIRYQCQVKSSKG